MAESEFKEVREDVDEVINKYLKMISDKNKARLVEFLKGVAFAEMCQEGNKIEYE